MKKIKSAVALGSRRNNGIFYASGHGLQAQRRRRRLLFPAISLDDAQVAVREKYIDEPLAEAFPDLDI